MTNVNIEHSTFNIEHRMRRNEENRGLNLYGKIILLYSLATI